MLAAMLAVAALGTASEANAADKTGNHAYCQWFKQLAMNTGDDYWWDRWRRCMRGDFWD